MYEYLHPIVTLTRCPSGGHKTMSVPDAMTGFGHGMVCTHEICASRTVPHTPIRGVKDRNAAFFG